MRIVCELFREPDVQLGFLWQGLTMGMLLSVPLMLAGIAFIVAARPRGAPPAATAAQLTPSQPTPSQPVTGP
jgi:phosphatidylglycerol---prolipoprotein diacylglyceryl transferase